LPTRSWSWPSLHRRRPAPRGPEVRGRPDPHDVDSAAAGGRGHSHPDDRIRPGGPDRGHETEISVVVSLVLLVVFTASIPFSIGKAGPDVGAEEGTVLSDRLWPIGLALVILAGGRNRSRLRLGLVRRCPPAGDGHPRDVPVVSPVWSSSRSRAMPSRTSSGSRPCSPTGATSPSASS